MLETSASRACSWVTAASLCSALLLLSCDDDASGKVAERCSADCPAEAPQLDFSGEKPNFEAHVRVVDASGKPVDKARVQIGERSATTDAEGRASIKNVDARSPAALKVSSDKAAPYYARTDAWKSGQTTHNVTLSPFALKTKVELEDTLVVQKDLGRLSLPAKSIANADGSRAKNANLELADLLGGDKESQTRLREFKAVDKNGMPSALKRVDALGHVRFTSDGGKALDLAPTKSALLELKLPDDSDAQPGDKRSLWSLDEKSLTLREESECVVEAQKGSGDKAAHVCKGKVSHFSVWAVATALDAGEPLALSCLAVRPAAASDACFEIEVERVFLLACDAAGEACTETTYRDALFARGEARSAAYCSLLDWSPSYRVAVLYDADVSGCSGKDAQRESGRRIKLSEPLSSDDAADAALLQAFTTDPTGTCASACTSLSLRIDAADLSAELLTDQDNDGHYGTQSAGAFLFPGRRADCDDGDPQIHPGAPELFCDDVDRNCDGERPADAHTADALSDDAAWNDSCALCGAALTRADEVPGNLLDEDCDGEAEDRDGDGVDAPEDCDDLAADVSPGGSELPGNPVDEDCDGVSLDWDGDGMPAPTHAYLAEAAGIDATRFIDCDDFDAAIYPDAPGDGNACASEPGEAGCPVFPWSGATVATVCEEALDNGVGTGAGVCVFGGWSDGSPLSLEPGQLWGPCDGGGPLAECPSDTQCGGPLPYADEFVAYLESAYTDGAPLAFQGMCFPRCDL